jgi:hypothetical protein
VCPLLDECPLLVVIKTGMENKKKNNDKLTRKDRKLSQKDKLPKISKRRKKDDSITITNRLYNTKISLKISASPEDWKLLEEHVFSSRKYGVNYFPSEFYGSFIYPLMDDFPKKEIGSHGTVLLFSDHRLKNNQAVVHNLKIQIALLWAFFSYWFKRSNKSWPEVLKTFTIQKKDKEWLFNKKGKPSPNSFSAFCIQKVFGSFLIRNYKINDLFGVNADSFNTSITYISEGKKMLKEMSNETLDSVESLLGFHNYWMNHVLAGEQDQIFSLMHALTIRYLQLYSSNYEFPSHISEEDSSIIEPLRKAFPDVRHTNIS